MQLPNKIFNLPVSVKEPVRLKGYPNIYTTAYDCTKTIIGGVVCLTFEPKGSVKPLQITKMFQSVSADRGMPCLLTSPNLTAYQRTSLSEHGVAWLKDGDNFHIPFLMASSSASRRILLPHTKLSAGAQQVAIHAIDGSWGTMTSTDVAYRIGKSLSSISSYFAEVASIEPSLIGSRGRTRFIVSPSTPAEKQRVFNNIEKHLTSPVKQRMLLVCNSADLAKLDLLHLPASGVSALSELTDIASDPWETRAIASSDKAALKALAKYPTLSSPEEGTPDIELEIWTYEPEERDLLSLYLDVREMSEQQNDERLGQAAADLKELVLNGR